MNTKNILLKVSKQGQLTLPTWLQEFGFERNKSLQAKINEEGELVISSKVTDPIEELKGMFKGAKRNPDFDGLDNREARQLRNKIRYEHKNKNIGHE